MVALPRSRALTHLESIGLGNAALISMVGRRPMGTHNPTSERRQKLPAILSAVRLARSDYQ